MKKHPFLFKKLQLLNGLGAHPAIHSNSDLAKQLGISRQAISRWCRGTATSQGDSIPDYLMVQVADLYGIDSHWFTFSLEEFETTVRSKLAAEKVGPVISSQQISIATMPITGIAAFGRESELATLDASWADPRINVVQILGFGGVGKSTLINRWLSDLSIRHYQQANRVYAWSFYWQGQSSELKSSADFFIEHALQWFGDPAPAKGSPWAKASRLAQLIRSYKTLLILDGMEPLQHPPGPRVGQIENPAMGSLIRELAADNNGLCVISSRLPCADLQAFRDGRVEDLELANLDARASQEVLSNLGIKGETKEFDAAISTYEGHPLSLSLLGGFLSVVHYGDIHRFRELKSLLSEKKKGSHAKNLMRVYLDWFTNRYESQILILIGLFDRGPSLDVLMKIARVQSIAGLTDKLQPLTLDDWKYGIDILEEANLITRVDIDGALSMDCHPIVRDAIDDYLREENAAAWQRGHSLIFEHLCDAACDHPSSMTELEPLFRAVLHGTQAGRYQEAFSLYHEKIKQKQFSIFVEGSHHADHACIRAFFEREWDQPVASLAEEARVFLLSSAAANLIYLGRIDDALAPSLKSIHAYIGLGKWLEAVTASGPLLSMLIAAGKLPDAFTLLDELQPIINKTNHPVIIALADNFRAYLLYLSGELEAAGDYFQASDKILTQCLPELPSPFPTISAYYCRYLLEVVSPQYALERVLKTFAWRARGAWQVKIDTTSLLGSDLITLGLTLLEMGDRVNAGINLHKQVELFKAADEWLYLPTGLNARAKYYLRTGEFDSAAADLESAMAISRRTGARFSLWEASLDMAQLNFARGRYRQSREGLDEVRNMPGMAAYRFRDKEIAQLAHSLKQTLPASD